MVKVAILGASGGVGQPLSLLLKLSPYVSELALYDIRAAEGIGKDLSHINTNSSCVGYDKDSIENTLSNAQVVLIPAGVPRKPGFN
ncbi:ASN_collapsed_G0008430.mRNA.1.CDS.1 [Saccharomyces cerevisiae]|nr:ASN_collapsed_G0008430.mRNA.1.CDS.1 [Saccharomyces cerevisiae]